MDRTLAAAKSPRPCHLLPAASLLAALESKKHFVLLESSRPSSVDRHSYLFTEPAEIVTFVEAVLAESADGG